MVMVMAMMMKIMTNNGGDDDGVGDGEYEGFNEKR